MYYIAGTFTYVLLFAFLLDCKAIASQLQIMSQVMFCSKKSGNFFDFRRFLTQHFPGQKSPTKITKGVFSPTPTF